MSDVNKRQRAKGSRAHGSTGPKTPEGKAKASQNSTTHGCCSKQPIIKGESEEEFNELLEDWMDDYRPRGQSERMLVRQAVEAQWVLKRNTNRFNELEEALQDRKATEWTEEEHQKMERFLRYRTTAERSFQRASTTVEQLVKRRRVRVREREDQAAAEAQAEQAEAEELVEAEPVAEEPVRNVMERKPGVWEIEVGAIHVLNQWADITIEEGRAVTRLEPSNEQLFEDRRTMEPPAEQVCRRLIFHDGIPEEYGWCAGLFEHVKGSPKCGEQQITIEAWLEALEREQAAGTGHLGDAGEDVPYPKRRTWCWCAVCARTQETIWRREREDQERGTGK